jgi:hypothetical protein
MPVRRAPAAESAPRWTCPIEPEATGAASSAAKRSAAEKPKAAAIAASVCAKPCAGA